jgi:hypothetical protein
MPQELNGHEQVHYHSPIWDYDRFLNEFAKSAYDIGIAPLLDDIFSRSKSNNKFREYGACGIAGIYSRVSVYTDCVKDGETGLLVPNDVEAWYSAIVRLVEDKQLRERIQRLAKEYVQSNYSQRVFEKVWYEQIRRVLIRSRKTAMVDLRKEQEQIRGADPIHLLRVAAHLLAVAGGVRSSNARAMLSVLLMYVRIRLRVR